MLKRKFKGKGEGMSRLKKKLLLYFLLIAIVSISVSAEIILEFSTPSFQDSIFSSIANAIVHSDYTGSPSEVLTHVNHDEAFEPLNTLRNRMILLLMVVSIFIFGAFQMFTRDIVSPMDHMVEATKKIADGDLTVSVPIMTSDEIGQVGELINDMNSKLQNMIKELRKEIDRHKENIHKVSVKVNSIARSEKTGTIIQTKKMKVGDFREMVNLTKEVEISLDNMSSDLSALYTFVNMYKTYKTKSEISQSEIEEAFKQFEETGLGEIEIELDGLSLEKGEDEA
jgi:methyl-accepting chemotaxis protein